MNERIACGADEFLKWLMNAVKGDRAIYHVGFLANDMVVKNKRGMTVGPRPQAAQMAWEYGPGQELYLKERAWAPAFGKGYVALTQRKIGPGEYEYIAERIAPLKARMTPWAAPAAS